MDKKDKEQFDKLMQEILPMFDGKNIELIRNVLTGIAIAVGIVSKDKIRKLESDELRRANSVDMIQ